MVKLTGRRLVQVQTGGDASCSSGTSLLARATNLSIAPPRNIDRTMELALMKSVRNLNGYRLIYDPDNPKSMTNANWLGYIYEHISVIEKDLGRPLKDGEEVHHLNGNRSDNRSSNLIVLGQAQHMKLHRWIDKGAPYEGATGTGVLNSNTSVPIKLRTCVVCGKTIQKSNNKKSCSNKCHSMAIQNPNKPSLEELKSDMSMLSWVKIGSKYGVSDNGARKWAKAYGIL